MPAGLDAGTAYLDILPRIGRAFGADLENGIKGDIDRVGQSAGSSIGGTLKKAAAVAAGAFAVAGGVQVFKGFLDEANESREVAAQTAAVLKSTGGAAKITASGVDTLATAISNKIGVDDEAIASGENLLLTFTNIQNRVGKGNDIFNQATQTVTDMSAALGQDMKSSAIQLGKALNDPVKGVTALQRVGVTFNDQQKEQIANMVKAGDVAGAQKVILAELGKEFGGSAASQATAGKKLSVVWGNIQEQLGGKLLPIVDKVATFLAAKLPGAIDKVTGFFGPLIQKASMLAGAFKAAFSGEGVTSLGLFGQVERLGVIFRQVWEQVKLFFGALTTGFTKDEGTPIESFALFIRNTLLPVIQQIVDWVQNHLIVVLIALGAIFLAVTSPVTLIVIALVAAYVKFAWFRDAVAAVVDFLTVQFQNFSAYMSQIWGPIQEAIGHFVNVAVDLWHMFGDNILGIARAIWDQIVNVIQTAVRIVRDIINFVLAVINGDWGKAWAALRDIPAAVFDFIIGTVRNAFKIIGEIVSAAAKIIDVAASGMWDGIKNAFKAAINFIIRAWNSLEFKVPGFSAGPVHFGGFTLGVPDIPELHQGGILRTSGLVNMRPGDELVFLPQGAAVAPLDKGLGVPEQHKHYTLGPVTILDPVDIEEQFRRMELLA